MAILEPSVSCSPASPRSLHPWDQLPGHAIPVDRGFLGPLVAFLAKPFVQSALLSITALAAVSMLAALCPALSDAAIDTLRGYADSGCDALASVSSGA